MTYAGAVVTVLWSVETGAQVADCYMDTNKQS